MEDHLEDLFTSGIEENKNKLMRLCEVYAKDKEEAKDIFQDALLNIWNAMPSFQKKSSIGPWMYRITLNTCMRSYSKTKKHKEKYMTLEQLDFKWLIQVDETNDQQLLKSWGALKL